MSDTPFEPLTRLKELGIDLPSPPTPLASYVATTMVPLGAGRGLLFVAGQLPSDSTGLTVGRVPDELSVDAAREAARLCAVNVLAQVHKAVGLENVRQILQLTGYILSSPGFVDHPAVLNGASDLLVAVLGDRGRHTRIAVGSSSLPRDASVEIACVLAVSGGGEG